MFRTYKEDDDMMEWFDNGSLQVTSGRLRHRYVTAYDSFLPNFIYVVVVAAVVVEALVAAV